MRKLLVAIPLLLGIAWVVAAFLQRDSSFVYGPPQLAGGVVQVSLPQGERIVFMTTQWEKRVSYLGGGRYSSSSRRTWSKLQVDVWQLDANTAHPVRRTRIASADMLGDVAALGVERGVLWARLPDVVGIRLEDGSIVADRARIEAANPSLKGLLPVPAPGLYRLPDSMQRMRFSVAEGLVILLEDGRRVRLDPTTLQASAVVPRPANAPTPPPAADTQRLEMKRLATRMQWDALTRGLGMVAAGGAGSSGSSGASSKTSTMQWLGLVAEHEVEQVGRDGTLTSVPNYATPARYRLYRGKIESQQSFMGVRQRFSLVAPLAEAPEWLQAGLLVERPEANPRIALWRREPDSVFVLHRDRLGDDGRWTIERIAGPAGRSVWKAELPLSHFELWAPGERQALVAGGWRAAERHTSAEPNEDLVPQFAVIDYASGLRGVFNLDRQRDWPIDKPAK
jgi:hypothetical protein